MKMDIRSSQRTEHGRDDGQEGPTPIAFTHAMKASPLIGLEETTRLERRMASVNGNQPTVWHAVDEELTESQFDRLMLAPRGRDTHTCLVWLKYRHPWLRQTVISPGHYDHDGGSWSAKLQDSDEDPHWSSVTPSAWAIINPGQRPSDGRIVGDFAHNLSD